MLDDIFDMFSQRSGLSSNIARMALPLVTSFLLRNVAPQKTSGFMSMLPSSITNMFSNDEKQEFKTSQKNISYDEIIKKISNECFNGDLQKAKKVYEEAINVIKRQIW